MKDTLIQNIMKKTVSKIVITTTKVEFSATDIEKMLLDRFDHKSPVPVDWSKVEFDWSTGEGGVVRGVTLRYVEQDTTG